MVEESPFLIRCMSGHGAKLSTFLRERVEVIEGDVSQPGLGFAPEVAASPAEKSGPHY